MANSSPRIELLLISRMESDIFNNRLPERIEFATEDSYGTKITLVPPGKEKDSWKNYLECKVTSSIEVGQGTHDFIRAYIEEKRMLRTADAVSLPHYINKSVIIHADGSFDGHSPRRNVCPSDIEVLIDKAECSLEAIADRFVNLLRWRQGIESLADPIESSSLYWRVRDGSYHLAPLPGYSHEIEAALHPGMRWNERDSEDINELWSADISEPLAHQLLREAASLIQRAPGSAIMMMTAALETGVKRHIGKIAPETEWLMEEMPSPPVVKLLRKYIPELHRNKGEALDYWENLNPFFKRVQTLVETRNKVAHTGKIPETAEPLNRSVDLVSDLLYLLDRLEGFQWASTLVSRDLAGAIGEVDLRHPRIIMRISC